MKSIYLLIGQKGSGKSYIGSLIDRHFNIRFLRVEDWVKDLKHNREISDESYLIEVFETIEKGVREALKHQSAVAFESTGLTIYFEQMLKRLTSDFKVTTLGIDANPNICLERVKTRDASIHIPISENQIRSINQQVKENAFITNFVIDNNEKSEAGLIRELERIVV